MSDDNATPEPAEVEREIGHTRAELAQTLDAIERRLNARDLVEKGFEMLKDSLIGGDAVNRSLSVVRDNPVPFALFGMGAAWLLASKTRVGDYAGDLGSRAGAFASDMAGKVGIGSSGEQPLGHTGNAVVDQGSGKPDGWVHQVSGMAQDALRSGGDLIGRAGGYAGGGAGQLGGRVSEMVREHPLVLGAVGIMAGALIASIVPLSEAEEEWIGGTRDEIWRRAEEAGQEAVGRARDAAARAATKAVDAATAAAGDVLKNELIEPSKG